MVTETHLHLRRKTKSEAHVRIIYMRYAVQVATDTEKTTYYPEEIDRMKEQLDVEKSKSNRKIKKGSSIQARN